jgi:hypothetical protein
MIRYATKLKMQIAIFIPLLFQERTGLEILYRRTHENNSLPATLMRASQEQTEGP